MKFRTEYIPEKSNIRLNPALPVVLAGSCFSQNIAGKMHENSWEALNPCGTLYNPLSIKEAIDIMCDVTNGEARFEKSLFEEKGIWSSWWFDSSFSALLKEDAIEEFKTRQNVFLEKLKLGKVLIVTFGTSICYFLSETDTPVGNCHKQPSYFFYRSRLSIDKIVDCWNSLLEMLRQEFPDLKVILTVSPVRHLKDGFEGNSRSKAILQLALEKICECNEDCLYFPAYEILNDDLRDYRFYSSDLCHPSEEAIDYIWQKFIDTFVDADGLIYLTEGSRKYKAAHHRPKTGALGKPLS